MESVLVLVIVIELNHLPKLSPVLHSGSAVRPVLQTDSGWCRDAKVPKEVMAKAFNGTVWASLDSVPTQEALPHELREVRNPSRYAGGLRVQGNGLDY